MEAGSIKITDLIECPFCESNDLKQIADAGKDKDGEWKIVGWYISCECGAKCGTEKDLADATARWNRDFDYFNKADGEAHLFTVKIIAFHTQAKDGGTESQVDFEAIDMQEARTYVQNNLDMSFEWTIKEL